VTSDPITAGLSQEADALLDSNCITNACIHCHVFLNCMDLCIWIELLKNSLIDIMDFIISRTKNNAIQEVLVILSSCVANSWIDSVDKTIEISTNHGLRNLNHLIIIYS